jgi:hypothetical protein
MSVLGIVTSTECRSRDGRSRDGRSRNGRSRNCRCIILMTKTKSVLTFAFETGYTIDAV